MTEKIKTIRISIVKTACCIAMLPGSGWAQCPDSDTAIGWGKLAVSAFYAVETYQDDRQQLGVSTDDLSLDEIVPVTDDAVCQQLENHIMASDEYHETTKNQSKVYFKNVQTGRYFFVSFTEPAQPGWSTGRSCCRSTYSSNYAYGKGESSLVCGSYAGPFQYNRSGRKSSIS